MAHALRSRTASRPHRLLNLARARTIFRDSLIALVLFGSLGVAIGWDSAPVRPIAASDVLAAGANPAQVGHSDDFVANSTVAVNTALPLPQLDARQFMALTDRTLAVAILASVFATIIAFNLWFLRHLGRVYASSRPGGGRRR